jgi:hypothetical protein
MLKKLDGIPISFLAMVNLQETDMTSYSRLHMTSGSN